MQRGKRALRGFGVGHDRALGDFDLEPVWPETRFRENRENAVGESGIDDLRWRHVQREGKVVWPVTRVQAGAPQNAVGQISDQTGILGDGNEYVRWHKRPVARPSRKNLEAAQSA